MQINVLCPAHNIEVRTCFLRSVLSGFRGNVLNFFSVHKEFVSIFSKHGMASSERVVICAFTLFSAELGVCFLGYILL